MKANKMILFLMVSVTLTSCFSKKYVISSYIERDGSCRRTIYAQDDSVTHLFPYDLTTGWEIAQTDTAVKSYLSLKNTKNWVVSKKFNSVDELSSGLLPDKNFPHAKESLKKRFRWFYTYYTFTAVYQEISEKGQVAMVNYLNQDERRFYFQGDLSAYKGLTGFELKDILNDIEEHFCEWYNRSMYEECFQIIAYFTDMDFRPELFAAKDTLYSIYRKSHPEQEFLSKQYEDLCPIIDSFFTTNRFSILYATNDKKMNDMTNERTKITDELLDFSIQYELSFPGKIIATNSQRQNNGALTWEVSMLNFLADDYILTAEWRTVNGWAFAIALLLLVFTVFCFRRKIITGLPSKTLVPLQ